MQTSDDPMFLEGDLISKYRVVKRLGRGGYGEIYSVVSPSGERLAVKVERATRPGNLKDEEFILNLLQKCKYVPHLKTPLQTHNQINFIPMDLFGENLSNLRRKQGTCFSLTTTIMLARQMLRCIREIHDAGILHRDIKPGNFLIGCPQTNNPRTILIIDFG